MRAPEILLYALLLASPPGLYAIYQGMKARERRVYTQSLALGFTPEKETMVWTPHPGVRWVLDGEVLTITGLPWQGFGVKPYGGGPPPHWGPKILTGDRHFDRRFLCTGDERALRAWLTPEVVSALTLRSPELKLWLWGLHPGKLTFLLRLHTSFESQVAQVQRMIDGLTGGALRAAEPEQVVAIPTIPG